MAEFQEVMKDWRRMCDTIKSCDDCPIQKEDGWTYVLCSEGGMSSVRPEVAEKVIVKWAAEHPEPVYPTWAEWLNSMGLIKHDTGQFCVHMPNQYSYKVKEVDILNEVAYKPIPADTAQKLGIEPKEDV